MEERISNYRIIRELGAGGMGEVYLAEDLRLKRQVAIKFLSAELANDRDVRRRFLSEARAASSLNHPNVCIIHEVDATEDGRPFMAMEYGDAVVDGMYRECFRPAVKDTGFDLRRLDDAPRAGVIDDRLRVEIRNARFLLADLTHHNRGAYWEAGYAEGLGRPVIFLCERSVWDDEKSKPHFDTNHCTTVIWEAGKPSECAAQLKVTIRATIPGEAKMTDD